MGTMGHTGHMSGRFVSVHDRGNLTLPADIRRQYGLDKPGVQVEILILEGGILGLRPHVAVPADQAWFWTDRWQKGERAVDEHVAAGRIIRAENIDDFVTAMKKGRRKTKRVP